MNLALFASGNGSNVQAIIDAAQAGIITSDIKCIVCDNKKAYVIERARKAGIDVLVLSPKDCDNRQQWEEKIINYLQEKEVDLVILAGFMRIIGEKLLTHFPQRIINIHPSLLPAFPGRNGISDAYEAGVSETGVTIHFVDSGIDTGQIITQEALDVQENWTLEDLEEHIHAIEHRLYPKTIQTVINQLKEEGIN